jgi:hypothetical protein
MKRILEIILTICMLLSILPTNVFAANITIFNVTVNKPKVGEELSYEASVPETASTYVTKVEWNGSLDALGKVMPGKYEKNTKCDFVFLYDDQHTADKCICG